MAESPEWKHKTLTARLGVKYADLTPEQKHQDQMERTRRSRMRSANKDVPKLYRGEPGLTLEERYKMWWDADNKKRREQKMEIRRNSPEHVALKNMILQFRSLGLPVSESNESPSSAC